MLRCGFVVLLLIAQERKEERGEFVLYRAGKKVGTEVWRIEEFGDGRSGIFAKTTVGNATNDTVLTLDRDRRPILFAGISAIGRAVLETRLAIRDGKALCDVKAAGVETKKEAKFGRGTLVLDQDAFVHAAVIVRGGARSVRVFAVRALGETDGIVEERSSKLRSGDKSVDVRVRTITVGRATMHVVLLDGGRVAAIEDASQGVTAYAPEYAGWERMASDLEETELTFGSLAGTFARPRGADRVPAVVLVGTFGPQDRDGNDVATVARGTASEMLTVGNDAAILRSIAHALASAGIASLRYDERGVGRSGGTFATAKLSDFVADARAAVAYVKSRRDVGKIGLVGHGEGALVAASAGEVSALFLLAAPAKPLDALLLDVASRELREQRVSDEAAARQLAKQRREFDEIRASRDDWMVVEGQRAYVGWLREHFAREPLREIGTSKAAVVVLQGLKDGTVLSENADLLEKAIDGDVKRFADLGHHFVGKSGRIDEGVLAYLTERASQWLK